MDHSVEYDCCWFKVTWQYEYLMGGGPFQGRDHMIMQCRLLNDFTTLCILITDITVRAVDTVKTYAILSMRRE